MAPATTPTSTALAAPFQVKSIVGHVRQQLPRVGKIRLGIKNTNQGGKEYPKEVDYFALDTDLPGREQIEKLYGKNPKRLLVTLLSSDPEEVFPHAYKMYGRGLGLVCRGDGVKAVRAVMRKDDGRDVIARDAAGRPQTAERACPCDFLQSKKCRPVGNLTVVLPEVGFGVYQIDTSSWWSMQNLRSDLGYLNTLLAGRGGVRGTLLWLVREPKETHGSGRLETHYPLRLVLPTPAEYAARANGVRALVEQYASVLPSAPALEGPPSVAALPIGSPVEEPDLVPPSAQVAPADVAAGRAGADSHAEEGGEVEGADDDTVGGDPIPPPELDAPALATDEQGKKIREEFAALVQAVMMAGIEPTAPNPDAAASAYLRKRSKIAIGDVARSLKAGTLTKDRAAEVLAALADARTAAAEITRK